MSELTPFYFFGCLLAFGAAAMGVFFIAAVRKKWAVGRWASAAGTVIESEAVWGTTTRGGRTARTWLARFAYEYEAGGRTYTGRRVAFYKRCTGSWAREFVARHPVGSRVRVYYDPARPAESVLDRSFRALWLLPFFAAVFGALAFVFFFKLPVWAAL